MVFSIFCAADVYGSKWNVSVEFPGSFEESDLSFDEAVEVIESAFEYECDRWKPPTTAVHRFYVEYLTLMEKDGGTYYSSERVTEANYRSLQDGAQVHVHQKEVMDSSNPVPPPRNTVAWRLVEMYGLPARVHGSAAPHIPSVFFTFDTRGTGIITKETMLEAFPYPAGAGRVVGHLFSKADPRGLGYVTFAAWLEFAATDGGGVEMILGELAGQEGQLRNTTEQACRAAQAKREAGAGQQKTLSYAAREVRQTLSRLSRGHSPPCTARRGKSPAQQRGREPPHGQRPESQPALAVLCGGAVLRSRSGSVGRCATGRSPSLPGGGCVGPQREGSSATHAPPSRSHSGSHAAPRRGSSGVHAAPSRSSVAVHAAQPAVRVQTPRASGRPRASTHAVVPQRRGGGSGVEGVGPRSRTSTHAAPSAPRGGGSGVGGGGGGRGVRKGGGAVQQQQRGAPSSSPPPQPNPPPPAPVQQRKVASGRSRRHRAAYP